MHKKLLLLPLLVLLLGATATHAQTPTLIADIFPGKGSSYSIPGAVFNGKLYIMAATPANGYELWSYDGVNAPSLAFDLNPGTGDGVGMGSIGVSMVVFNNRLYFCGDNGTSGYELFSYDGTNPPVLVTDLEVGSGSSYLSPKIIFNNKLVCNGRPSASGQELYIYDGVNTPVLYDIFPGPTSSSSYPEHFCEFNGKLYFRASNGNSGGELFSYDPASNNVSLIADINTGASSDPSGMVVLGGKMYFMAKTAANGYELYSYDGTSIARLTDLTVGVGNGISNFGYVASTPIMPYNGKLYMSGATDGRNYQLYTYDPSNGSTTLVHAMNSTGDSDPCLPAVYHGQLYVIANTSTTGYELWATDGNTTNMLSEIAPGLTDAFITPSILLSFIEYNGSVYFGAGDTATTGYELYRLTTPASVQSVRFDGSVKVYPNPATHTASLELELQSAHNLSVSLTDAMGRKVYESAQVSCPAGKTMLSIPMETLAPGVYLYRVQDTQDGLLQSGQIGKH